MRIGSILENKNLEKRIAITPEIIKKYISLGFKILLSKNYGFHLGIKDEVYKDSGAEIIQDDDEIIKSSDIIIQLGLPKEDKISMIKENQILIGSLNPFNNQEKLENLAKKKNKCFLIRITSKNN